MENKTRLIHINNNFTANKVKYEENIEFWRKNIFNKIGNEFLYENWLKNVDGSNKHILNGNPAYSLIDKAKTRALRIMQLEPRSKKPYLAAWIEDFELENETIPVLAIGLELSNKTQIAAITLIEHWFINYNETKFRLILDKYNILYEKNYTPSDEERAFELHEKISEEINNINIYNASDVLSTHSTTLRASLYDNFYRLFVLKNELDTYIDTYEKTKYSAILRIFSALTALTKVVSINNKYKLDTQAKATASFSKKYIGTVKTVYGIVSFNSQVVKHIQHLKQHNEDLFHELVEKK